MNGGDGGDEGGLVPALVVVVAGGAAVAGATQTNHTAAILAFAAGRGLPSLRVSAEAAADDQARSEVREFLGRASTVPLVVRTFRGS